MPVEDSHGGGGFAVVPEASRRIRRETVLYEVSAHAACCENASTRRVWTARRSAAPVSPRRSSGVVGRRGGLMRPIQSGSLSARARGPGKAPRREVGGVELRLAREAFVHRRVGGHLALGARRHRRRAEEHVVVEQRQLEQRRPHGREHARALAQAGLGGARGERRHEDERLFGHELGVGAGVDDGQRDARDVLRGGERGGRGERGDAGGGRRNVRVGH